MPYKFQYVPTSGPLSGQAFEDQTERAINEIGADIDAAQAASSEAVDIAQNAQAAAAEALGTANQALTEAQNATAQAQDAKGEADAALIVAQNAQTEVNGAVDAAANAAGLAETAQATAESSQSAADAAFAAAEAATETAVSAESLAREAMALQSGGFATSTNTVDADTLIESARIYAATEILNVPAAIAAPAYLEVMPNSEETSVTQAVWAENSPQQYLRTGLTVWSVNAGESDFTLTAVPDDSEAASVEGVLSVQNNGTAMSAAFTPGGFIADESGALTLSGALNFTLGAGFLGAIMHGNAEIVRVAETGDETESSVIAVIVNPEMTADKAGIIVTGTDYTGDTLTLQLGMTWTDRTPSTTWGTWITAAGDLSGLPLGSWIWSPLKTVPFGFLDISKDNGLLSRAAFPQLWETIKDDGNVISEANYQASVSQFGGCGSFSSGDGATTFRLPIIAGLYARAYDPANSGLASGKCLGDAIRNITGGGRVVSYNSATNAAMNTAFSQATGSFTLGGALQSVQGVAGTGAAFAVPGISQWLMLDASLQVPTASENRPKTVCQTPIMKVYSAATDAGEANIAALVAATADLAGRLKESAYSQVLTTSGAWTAPYDGYYLVEVQAGGGAGGSVFATVDSAQGGAAGGHSGGYQTAAKYYSQGEVVSCVIGAGGAANASGGPGGNGGDSTFDGIVADGGIGGYGYSAAIPGEYRMNIPPLYAPTVGGNSGMVAADYSLSVSLNAVNPIVGGIGGTSRFGRGGSGGTAHTGILTNGYPATGYGAGGGGAGLNNIIGTAKGGIGTAGCVKITYIGV